MDWPPTLPLAAAPYELPRRVTAPGHFLYRGEDEGRHVDPGGSGIPGSEEFTAVYAMALAGRPDATKEIGANRTPRGTVNALIVSYSKSDAWSALSEDTRKTRRRIIERFRVKHGDKRVALLRRDHVAKMLAEITKPSKA